MSSFNKLSAAQIERLTKLTEECGEISQMVGKDSRPRMGVVSPTRPQAGEQSC
jgi:hypothetical protein